MEKDKFIKCFSFLINSTMITKLINSEENDCSKTFQINADNADILISKSQNNELTFSVTGKYN